MSEIARFQARSFGVYLATNGDYVLYADYLTDIAAAEQRGLMRSEFTGAMAIDFYRQGRAEMLARCVKTLVALPSWDDMSYQACRDDVISALQALEDAEIRGESDASS